MTAYLAALRRRHEARRAVLPPVWAARDSLLQSTLLALLLGGAAAAVTLAGGYHAGFHAINDAARPLSDRALSLVTYAGDTVPALLLLAPFAHRFRQLVWFALIAALVATVFTHGMKPLLDLPRPPAVLDAEAFRLVGSPYRRVSFPSGHSVTAFVTVAVLAWHLRPAWLRGALILVGALIAASRVGVGAHWPVDTLGGAALGLLATAVAARLMKRWPDAPGFWPYHLLVLVLVGICGWGLWLGPPYPLATPLLRLLAVTGLFCLARDFVWAPLREMKAGTTALPDTGSAVVTTDAMPAREPATGEHA
ncbi:phosphatase PAP2 family protein [Derxia gummosa]|uniref:Phosphatase PAP2 family protein n=1 Tax=Derxia gummosa DSM 723 TaxID=1121388 RepID=A0A8B6X907_9BURK|nr:phosphatase PAP2 family protein [Derxia gummosa]